MCHIETRTFGQDETQIYVADLAAYSAGVLHGVWLDAADD